MVHWQRKRDVILANITYNIFLLIINKQFLKTGTRLSLFIPQGWMFCLLLTRCRVTNSAVIAHDQRLT